MYMKKLIIAIAVVLFATSVSAQEFARYDESAGTYERVTKKGPYLTNKFFDNWFIGVAGGVNLYTGHGDAGGSFSKRIAPAMDLNLGKWFTPSVGLRFQASGFWAQGWLGAMQTDYTEGDKIDGRYKKKFNQANVHADFLWNISNAIGGFKNERTWDFVPYFGFGVAHSWKDDYKTVTHFAMTVGLLNNIRLGDVVDLTLEGKYMMVKPDFDKFSGGKKLDGQVTVTAGLSFKLGPKGGFKRPIAVAPADYTPYKNRISRLEGDLDDANARIAKLAKDLEAERNRPVEKTQIVAPAAMTVFFEIGQSFLTDKDMINLEDIAKTIKASPNKKYTVTGYADSSTGSAARNTIISRQRAESVANALVEKFGVTKSQLVVDSKGGVADHKDPKLDRRALVKIE